MKHAYLFIAAVSVGLGGMSEANAVGSDPSGVWLDDTGRGAIEIKACGAKLCGYVVAVKNAKDTKGCGKQIIGDARPASGGRWDNGWIYSPEKRKNYDVELKPLSNGTLRVVGYAGTKLFSRTMIWTQAPADLKRCDVANTAAKPATPETDPAPKAADATPATTPATPPVNAADNPAAAASDSTVAKTEPPKTNDAKTDQPAAQSDAAKTDTAEADADTEGGEQPGERSGGKGLKIGDLDLDNVLTRTASGKCKLDLPWVKVNFDCER